VEEVSFFCVDARICIWHHTSALNLATSSSEVIKIILNENASSDNSSSSNMKNNENAAL
jgi:hypothetical protein